MRSLPLCCPYPDCGGHCRIEEERTEWYRTLYIECTNTACRAQWHYNGNVREPSHLPAQEEILQ